MESSDVTNSGFNGRNKNIFSKNTCNHKGELIILWYIKNVSKKQ